MMCRNLLFGSRWSHQDGGVLSHRTSFKSALMESVISCPYTYVIPPPEEEASSEGGDRHRRPE